MSEYELHTQGAAHNYTPPFDGRDPMRNRPYSNGTDMTTKTDDLQDRIGDLLMELAERNAADALSIATGVFVSMTLAAMRGAGHSTDGQIRIKGGENRNITIHAPKERS